MTYLRKSQERGFTDIDWLKSRHSFSFGDYYSPGNMGFESLRVINEDWIGAGRGFGAHPHRDMEILTYVVEGGVRHKDSTGTEGVIRPGELQLMRAGRGIVHSEMNASAQEALHLLQIWIYPDRQGLEPAYQQADFSPSLDNGEWTLLASPSARDRSLQIHQNVDLWARRFAKDEVVKKTFHNSPSSVWVQVVKGELSVAGQTLSAGDGLGLKSQSEILIDAKEGAEALFFVFRG
jgi:redox-sensitive bicupin YhaK (pirin superfamily)